MTAEPIVDPLDRLCVNTLRFLAVDAVEAAKSGHPGMPLGAAPAAYVLWDRFRRHNPSNPHWFNRDRFVLSAGHGCALQYALLYLTGYDLSLEEIKRFRQWGSKTPGHPEYGLVPGVESTTGPLGQGFANGIGMAVSERFLANQYNRDGFPVVDHHTYAIVSDGDLMEGVASEAASLAGLWKLGKIIYLYDDNRITIEGSTDLSFLENIPGRFESYGWHVEQVKDGNDLTTIGKAIENARNESGRPSLIMVRTHIGFGSPKQDSASAHGEPLGEEAALKTKEFFEWPSEPRFYVPDEAKEHFRKAVDRGAEDESEWEKIVEEHAKAHPDLAVRFRQIVTGDLPPGWDKGVEDFPPEDGPVATRAASGKVLNKLAERLDNLLGGSADLAPSNKTLLSSADDFGLQKRWGPNIHFGVREHAMGSILNGAALHGGVIPYCGTFLVFSDYMRPAIRLAALSGCKVIFIFTHDSVGLGEDGPTHQPVEHLMSLRAIPDLIVIRPADANETAWAWKLAIEEDGPTALVLTRQKLPVLSSLDVPVSNGVRRGAYVLSEAEGNKPQIIVIATGSEVHLALEAKGQLSRHGIEARVVSMPSWELFERQSGEYRRSVLLPGIPKLAIEAGSSLGWFKYVGEMGDVVGLDRFGASAPGVTVLKNLGFNVDEVVSRSRALVDKSFSQVS